MRKEKEQLLNKSYQEFIEIGLNIRPIIDELKHLIDPQIMGFGTTEDERIFSRQGFIDLIKRQEEQAVGLRLEHQVKPVHRRVLSGENAAIYVDDFIMGITTGSDRFELKMRFSIVFEFQEKQWIVVHWHGSKPEEVKSEEDTWGIDIWKKKTEELEQIVLEKTADLVEKNRELEIEAALERVRAVAMGMKKPEDMLSICRIISEQLQQFRVSRIRNIQTAIINKEKGIYLCYQYFTAYNKEAVEQTEYLKSPVEHGMVRQMLASKDGHFTGTLSGKELEEFREHRKAEGQFPDPLLDESKEISHCFLSIGEGGLGLTLYEPLDTATFDLFKRFHQVFSLAYSRFQDIEKAEARAREVEIDLALERVRAQTMAMHSSEDVGNSVVRMFAELTALGVDEGTRFGIGILNHENENNQLWTARKYGEEVKMHIGNIDMASHPLLKSARKAWKAQIPFHKYVLEGDDLLAYYKMLNTAPDYKIEIPIEKLPQKEIQHCFIFEHGFFYAFTRHEFDQELIQITKRFSTLFEQTYRRYLDLVTAETQAREAKIEAALERVRSRSLAMHHSSELSAVVDTLLQEFINLEFSLTFCIINLIDGEDMSNTVWAANPETGKDAESYYMKFEDFDFHRAMWNAWKDQDKRFVYTIEGEEKKIYDEYLYSNTEFRRFPKHVQEANKALERYVAGFTFFRYSGLQTVSVHEISEADLEILERFGKVFEQAYTRFLDLQKAEAQTREAQVNLAVERVRAKALAMFKSEEILEVVNKLKEEIMSLDIPNVAAATIHLKEPDGSCRTWDLTSIETEHDDLYLPLDIRFRLEDTHPDFFMRRIWENEADYFIVIQKESDFKHTLQWLRDNQHPEQADEAEEFFISTQLRQVYHPTVPLNNGRMNLDLLDSPTPEVEFILKKMAGAFDLAYKRFEDLQKAEAQSREAKIELALERVRARTMAMQHSEELAEAAFVLFEQLRELGGNLWGTGFGLCEKDSDQDSFWFANKHGVFPPVSIPHTTDPAHQQMYEGWKTGESFLALEASGQELKCHYDYMLSVPEVKPFFQKFLDEGIIFPNWQQWNATYFKQGYLLIITLEPYPNSEILKRFAKVFEQTYTRFLDLRKAEEQAREAQIQLALERVRAKTMAMKTQSDLLGIIELFGEQLSAVDVRFDHVTFIEGSITKKRDWDLWSYVPEAENTTDKILIPYIETPYFTKTAKAVEAFERTGNPIQVKSFTKKEKNEFLDHYWKYAPAVSDDIVDYLNTTPGSIIVDAFLEEVTVSLVRWGTEPYTVEELVIFERFAKEFKQTYIRFLDIKKAETQAREAQIEAALERIRAKAMAMHHSDELNEVLAVLCEQFDTLGISPMSTHMTVLDIANNKFTFRETGKFGNRSFGEQTVALDAMDTWKDMVESWKNAEPYSINRLHFPKETLPQVWEIFHESFASMPEDSKIKPDDYPDGIYHTAGKHPFGYIGMNQVRPATSEEEQIVIKFSNEFGRAYQRFLDLQKAEAQAREAQIEAALEKVRAQSMSMQHSNELQNVIESVYDRLVELGIEIHACTIITPSEHPEELLFWFASSAGLYTKPFHMPINSTLITREFFNGFKNKREIFSKTYSFKEKNEFFNYIFNHTDFKNIPENRKQLTLESKAYSVCNTFMGYSGIQLNRYSDKPFSKQESEILVRFGKAFEQTYTRFLDLQKAEAQAREAKIEVALEKVRSRTMGMQSSEELPAVANLLFNQIQALGIPAWSCGYNILFDDKKSAEAWMSSEGTLQEPFILRLFGEASFDEMGEFILSNETMLVQELGGKELEAHYTYMKSFPDLSPTFEKIDALGISLPTYQINHLCKFSRGFLLFITYQPVPEAHPVFKRFTNVFDQTYTRFLDLQKAEAQAREAQIEAALEKVRSRSLAMQDPEELTEVAQLLREEMGMLGVEELETSSIYIHDETSNLTQCWFTIKNSQHPARSVSDQMVLNLQDTWVGNEMLKFYRSTENKASILMKGEQRVGWIRYCESKSELLGKSEFYGETIPERTYHLYKFSDGFLGAASSGPISAESWDLMRRATAVFAFAFTRFQDLQVAQASAKAALRQASLDRVRADISSMRTAADLDKITPLLFKELTTLGIPFIRCGVFIINEKTKVVEAFLSSPEGKSLGVLHLPFDASELTFQTVEAWRKGEVYRQHWDKEDFIQWIQQIMKKDLIQDEKTYQGAAVPPESLNLHFVPFTQGMFYVGSAEPLSQDEIDLIKTLSEAFAIAYSRYEDFVKLDKAKADVEHALNELKSTQAQLIQSEKMASLGELTAGIAHEIQNPLNFVNNFSDVSKELMDEVKSERSKVKGERDEELEEEILNDIASNLEKINHHGKRADAIVKGMLEHSRTNKGEKALTDLNALADEFTRLSYHGLRAKDKTFNADFKLELDPNLPKVNVVASDIGRVMLNLVNNAFYAVHEKANSGNQEYKPVVIVGSMKTENGVELSVKDNGNGIPDSIKEKIFQPFFTTKPTGQGTGLGLSLSYDIVKAHGGVLKAETREEEGSTFTIQIAHT